MGTPMSVLTHHVNQIEISIETLAGVLLVLPFLYTYVTEAIDVVEMRENKLPRATKEEYVVKASARTLCSGDMMGYDTDDCIGESSISTALVIDSRISPQRKKSVAFEQHLASPSSLATVSVSSPAKSLDLSTITEEDENPKSGEHLEKVAHHLVKRAKTANDQELAGICKTLLRIGELLIDGCKFRSAVRVLEKTERVHKAVIEGTIMSVASAMLKQGYLYKLRGDHELANIYRETAGKLSSSPSAESLRRSWLVHATYKPKAYTHDEQLFETAQKVQRRLEKASAEAIPLAKTLKALAKAKALYVKQLD